jgi:hypothetical protein
MMLRTLFFTLILSPLDTSKGVDFEVHTGLLCGI